MSLPAPPPSWQVETPSRVCLSGKLDWRARPSTSLLFKTRGSVPSVASQEGSPGPREKSSCVLAVGLSVQGLASLASQGFAGRWPGQEEKGREYPSHTSGSPPPGQETRLLLTLGTLRGLELVLKKCPIYPENQSNSPRWGSIWSQNP